MANRIVTATVTGETIKLSDKNAGAAGSFNAVSLAFTFDSAWDDTTKKLYFFDSFYANPVYILLTVDYYNSETGVYTVPIPAEPLAYAGNMTITIKGVDFATDGTTAERIIMSASTEMKVASAIIPSTDTAPAEPTPTQAEQLQSEIDGIITDLAAIPAAVTAAQNSATAASGSATAAAQSATDAETAQGLAEAAQSSTEATAAAFDSNATAKTTAFNDNATSKTSAFDLNAANANTTIDGKVTTATNAATDAETAQTAAEGARDLAISAKTAAELAETNAETAQGLAEAAKTAAELAETNAETAQAAAELAYTNIQTAIAGKVDTDDIVNDLTTGGTAVPLSAEQGKALAESEQTVTQKMTLVKSNNLVTDSDFTSGYMAEDGTTYSSASCRYSKKIAVEEGNVVRIYYLSGGVWQRQSIRFATAFNGNTAVSSEGTQDTSAFTVPSGIDGLVITTYNGTNTMICIDYEPTVYEEYFDPYYLSTYDFIKDILPPVEIPEVTPAGHNMVNLDDLVTGYYYGSGVGRKISFSNSTSFRAAVLPVEPNTDYYVNANARFWAFTDDNDIVVSYGESSIIGTINSGNATKFYFSNSASTFTNETTYGTSYALIIAKGDHGASTRVKKPEFISGITQNMMDAKYGCALPIKVLNFTVGFNETWYYKNMLALEGNKVSIGIDGKGEYVNGGILITPFSSGSSANGYGWSVYDERLAQIAQQSQRGMNRKADNLASCTVLVIGDSTVEQNEMTQGMLDLFAEREKTLTLLGSRGTAPNLHEGRAGWSAYDYCSISSKGSTPNLFFNPTTNKFDFSYYMNNQGYTTPDFVVIQLGINDLYNKTFMNSDSIINQTVGYVLEIIASIKAFNANQKILLNLPTAINEDQKKQYGMIALIRNMFVRYNGAIQLAVVRDSNIICSYCHLILDPENDISDDVHPTTAGYQKMAAEVVSQINCWQQA